jgi:hypothetical protein
VQNAPVRLPLPFFASISSILALSAGAIGCNEAPLISAPDSGVACEKPQPIYPCVAGDAGLPGCTPDLDSLQSLGQEVVIAPGSYPAGCGVQVNATVLDQDNQCTQLGTCTCDQDGGTFAWVCYASH